ncbi:MAG: PDDEXK nuclease domain-containing protein [Pyrinomonadaceae bacterium]
MKSFPDEANRHRRYWVWVADQRSYLDEMGNERADLDPKNKLDNEGWWTCHRDTKKGDLILLYRSNLKKDLGYLIQAATDAYSIADDEIASSWGWDYGCNDKFLYKFNNPITLQDLRDNPYIQDWGAYRGNFQKRVYEIPPPHWRRLNTLLSERNRGYKTFLSKIEKTEVSSSIILEEQLEEELSQDLSKLKKFDFDLEICSLEKHGFNGRQYVCKGNGGRIDLLCFDITENRYVVIELKNVRASENTFGQISNYVGWVKRHIRNAKNTVGLVISRGSDVRFQSALNMTDKIYQIDLDKLGFE